LLLVVRVELGTWTVVHVHVHVRVHCGNGIGSSGPLLVAEVLVEKISHVRQGKQDGSGDKTSLDGACV
jgi:homoserine kinase